MLVFGKEEKPMSLVASYPLTELRPKGEMVTFERETHSVTPERVRKGISIKVQLQ